MKKKPKEGNKVRIVACSNDHNYTVGGIYTVVHVDESDSTLKARDANGVVGNWIRWSDTAPCGTVGWDFIKKVLPPDTIEFLSAFDSIEHLELSGEVKDAILLTLPDLHERILAEATKPKDHVAQGSEEPDIFSM
jgi:hypothetical protein